MLEFTSTHRELGAEFTLVDVLVGTADTTVGDCWGSGISTLITKER